MRLPGVQVLALCLLAAFAGPVRAEDPAHRRLAEHYAPVVFQESRSSVLDFVTRFDYDGDWRGDNNWRNAYLFDLPGYVYYSVIESSRHYFITYAFYHPRDYTATPFEGFAPKTEHENDLEGCTVTVEKNGTEFGTPILLQTLAHDVFFKYDNRDIRRVAAGAMRLDGPMTFLDGRPAVYIEPEGHGVKAATAAMIRTPAAFPGLVYRYTGQGTVPRGNRDAQAGYDLISIEDTLWAHRFDVGSTYCCADQYPMPGAGAEALGSAFNGPIGGCAARPPWGWDQANDPLAKGDWFRDPLRAYAAQLRIENFTGTYSHNPYLQAARRSAAPACRESATSKTVRGALTASLLGIGQAITADGLGRGQIGGQARQLFLNSAVLLEWARTGEFERWSWDQTLSALPRLISDGVRDELRLPRAAGFSFVSPDMQAPARYFDSVVLRYRTPLDGLSARVSWVHEAGNQFSNEQSVVMPLPRAEMAGAIAVRLTDNPNWDRGRSVVRIRVTIESAEGTVATATPDSLPDSEQLAISQIVFDRDAFSNTFEARGP
jgi:hypothetical protein